MFFSWLFVCFPSTFVFSHSSVSLLISMIFLLVSFAFLFRFCFPCTYCVFSLHHFFSFPPFRLFSFNRLFSLLLSFVFLSAKLSLFTFHHLLMSRLSFLPHLCISGNSFFSLRVVMVCCVFIFVATGPSLYLPDRQWLVKMYRGVGFSFPVRQIVLGQSVNTFPSVWYVRWRRKWFEADVTRLEVKFVITQEIAAANTFVSIYHLVQIGNAIQVSANR